MNDKRTVCYEFDLFHIDVLSRSLLHRHKKRIALAPKAFALLLALVRNSGSVLSKDRLMNAIWAGTHVEESNLTVTLSILRKTLGEHQGRHRYIVTVPGKGYRFVRPVRILESDVDFFQRERRGSTRLTRDGKQQVVRSIAVLPFESIDGAKGSDATGLGIANALTTSLSNVAELRVLSTGTILGRLNAEGRTPAARHNLKVDYILEGCHQTVDDHLRITVQLVDVGNNTVLWGQKFDGKLTNILKLQDVLCERVSNFLTVNAEKLQIKN